MLTPGSNRFLLLCNGQMDPGFKSIFNLHQIQSRFNNKKYFTFVNVVEKLEPVHDCTFTGASD